MDIVGVFSTKHHNSVVVHLNFGEKLFNSGVGQSACVQAGVGILVRPRLVNNCDEWIKRGEQVCLLKHYSK